MISDAKNVTDYIKAAPVFNPFTAVGLKSFLL